VLVTAGGFLSGATADTVFGVIRREQNDVDGPHRYPTVGVDVWVKEVGGALILAELEGEPRAFPSGSRLRVEVALLSWTGGLERPSSCRWGRQVQSQAWCTCGRGGGDAPTGEEGSVANGSPTCQLGLATY
jgi:hypothetical protein